MTHRQAALAGLVGGALLAIGAFLPWLSARSALVSQSLAGTDTNDGLVVLGLGVVIGLTALLHLDKGGIGTRATLIGLGGLALALVVLNILEMNDRVAGADSPVSGRCWRSWAVGVLGYPRLRRRDMDIVDAIMDNRHRTATTGSVRSLGPETSRSSG